MESKAQHINRLIGLPWVQGSDDPANGGLDCWGAVVYSYKCIDCITLPTVLDREACDLNGSAQSGLDDYVELTDRDDKEGAIFCCYDANGQMVHIGRILLGQAYHAVGNPDDPRAVELWERKTLERVYSMGGGTIKYIRYKGE
jgi:hypothetical protein